MIRKVGNFAFYRLATLIVETSLETGSIRVSKTSNIKAQLKKATFFKVGS